MAPDVDDTAAAAAPTSRGSIIATRAWPAGAYSRPSAATCAAAASRFDMYQLDRRITHPVAGRPQVLLDPAVPVPERDRRARLGPTADSLTTRRTPAATAASMAPVSQPTRRGSSAQDRKSVLGAVQRGAHGPRVRQVTDGQLDVRAELAPGRAGIAHEGTHPLRPARPALAPPRTRPARLLP